MSQNQHANESTFHSGQHSSTPLGTVFARRKVRSRKQDFRIALGRWFNVIGRSVSGVALALLASFSANSAEPPPLAQEVAQFLNRAQPLAVRSAPPEAARYSLTPEGHLTFFGAAPGHHVAMAAAMGQPEQAARQLLKTHGRIFGVTSPAVDFAHLKTRRNNGRSFVRLEQTYAGIPVFAARVTVQLNAQDGVESVMSDILRDTKPLDDKIVSTSPALPASEASAKARELFAAKVAAGKLLVSAPRLAWFAPSVLDEAGDVRLAWEMVVSDASAVELNERIFIDAQSGELVRQYPLHCEALNRQIYNAGSTVNVPSSPERTEGQAPTATPDVNSAYDFLGDTYNFYHANHGRDSIDGKGLTLTAIVRLCQPGQCPWKNARWNGSQMLFGDGFTVDDVTAHELTHGVTANESELVYANASGAINESFSDVWGEFVDLTNGRGDDRPEVRWDIGEDLPGGRIRSMKNPPAICNIVMDCSGNIVSFCSPDRLGSPFYVPPASNPQNCNDNGGVHFNSGVNNKLCYLLTDGDSFNGQTISGLGIARVAALYYEVNANLLNSGANWTDLYNALTQSAINLGWSMSERNNLYRGCLAVEIASAPRNIYVDRSSGCWLPQGERDCTLNFGGPFQQAGAGLNSAQIGDNLFIRTGSYNEPLTFDKIMVVSSYDGPVTIGK